MYLPKNESTFYCKIQGEKTKQWFEGNFVVKCCLNIEEQVQVAINTDRLNQGSLSIAPQYALINRALAEINMRIQLDKNNKPQCPSWWIENRNGATLMDPNVVYHVFSEVMKAEKEWGDRLSKEVEDAEKRAQANPAPTAQDVEAPAK